METRRNLKQVLLLAVLALPLLAACESKEEKANRIVRDSMQAARARGETDLANPEMGAKMQVELTEFGMKQSHKEVPKGQVTIVVENKGKMPHTFEVKSDSADFRSMPIPAGSYVLMAFVAQPGTYDMFCPDSSGAHRDRGMTAKLVVK